MGKRLVTFASRFGRLRTASRHKRAFAFQAAMLVGMWAVFASSMWVARDQARDAAVQSLGNLSTALALDIAHDVELLDGSMQAAAVAWSNDEIRALKPSLRRLAVFDNVLSTRHFGRLTIVDAYGAVLTSSDEDAATLTRSFTDRPEFKSQIADARGLFVGQAFIDPADGEWSVPLSRALLSSDGRFDGAVLGTLKLSFLRDSYRRIHLGPGAILALARDDGHLIDREPPPPVSFVQTPVQPFAARVGPSVIEGSIRARSQVDGQDRIYSFHRVGALPLVQFAAMPASQVYADWWQRTTIMAGILGLLSFGTLMLQHLLRRELLSRVSAEQKLQALASLDPLTGIANRRAFDAAAAREWASGGRRGTVVGLLMVDVDSFKPFNDRYGHLVGDQALVQIAQAVSAVAERHGGLACRFGGEEFALLLSGIGEPLLRVVAQDLVEAVHELAVPSTVALDGRITISVGGACAIPTHRGRLEELMASADRHLYAAKEQGRNRVVIAAAGLRRAA